MSGSLATRTPGPLRSFVADGAIRMLARKVFVCPIGCWSAGSGATAYTIDLRRGHSAPKFSSAFVGKRRFEFRVLLVFSITIAFAKNLPWSVGIGDLNLIYLEAIERVDLCGRRRSL